MMVVEVVPVNEMIQGKNTNERALRFTNTLGVGCGRGANK